jgi:hypothetical protein
VSIYARTLIKPTIAEARINTQNNAVPATVIQEVGEVETERYIAIVVAADEASVDKHKHIAKCTVELDPNAPPEVACWNFEFAAVPTHARFRISTAQGLIPMRAQLIVPVTRIITDEWEFNGPVVRKV